MHKKSLSLSFILVLIWVGLEGSRARGAEFSVRLTVTEPAGVEREGDPASGGFPFLKGQVRDPLELALFDDTGRVIPAQFSPLARYEDGSLQWALADFLADVPAGGQIGVTVRKGKTIPPSHVLEIKETDTTISVDTHSAQFTVSKTRFGPLDSVVLGEKSVVGAGKAELANAEGRIFRAGAPSRVAWEYRGPLRATLRVDGPYVDDGGEVFVWYTTRLTFWSGVAAVRIEHSIRNSNPKEGNDAKLRFARISFPLGFEGQDQGSGVDWFGRGDGTLGCLLTCHHTGGCFPGGGRKVGFYRIESQPKELTVYLIPEGGQGPGYGEGHFALADCAHKDTELWLEFYKGTRDAKVNEARYRALLGKLHALADGAWISETETLGSGRFGTLNDEIETYKRWGWKGWDEPKKEPKAAPNPHAYVARELIHNESEADSAEGLLLQYVRTGQRGFFDEGESWARYYKTHYAYRTDGFEFSRTRPNKGLKVGWYGPQQYGWSDSRAEKCHFYGRGIFDYYCLTGDLDALEAGRDLLEQARDAIADTKPGGAIGYYGVRGFARMWLTPIRAAQLSREAADREVADRFAEIVFKASDWDARGFVRWGAGPSYMASGGKWLDPNKWPARVKEYMEKEGRTLSPRGEVICKDGTKWSVTSDGGTWQQAALGMALERYYQLTGSTQARQLAIRMAEFARDYQISRKCGYAFYYTILDFPDKGKVYDLAEWTDEHANCPGPGAKHDGHYTRFFPDVFARAYSLTGEKQWLELAQQAWNRGSKRGYQTDRPSAADDEVFKFAWHVPPKDDCVLTTVRMFYEVPRAK